MSRHPDGWSNGDGWNDDTRTPTRGQQQHAAVSMPHSYASPAPRTPPRSPSVGAEQDTSVSPQRLSLGLLSVNFDSTADLQDAIYDAENGDASRASLLSQLKQAVTLLQQRESEVLRIAVHGNELAGALSVAQAELEAGKTRRQTTGPSPALLASKDSIIATLKEELVVQQHLPRALAKERDALRRDMDSALHSIETVFSSLRVQPEVKKPLPGTHPLMEMLESLVNMVQEKTNEAVSAQSSQRMQEEIHRRLITSYEARLNEAEAQAPLLRKERKAQNAVSTAVQTSHSGRPISTQTDGFPSVFDLEEKDIEVSVARDRVHHMEEQVASLQEQHLDEKAQLTETRAQICELERRVVSTDERLHAVCSAEAALRMAYSKSVLSRCALGQTEAVSELNAALLEWGQTDAGREEWQIPAVAPSVADVRLLLSQWGDGDGDVEVEVESQGAERTVPADVVEVLRKEVCTLQNALTAVLEQKGELETELADVKCERRDAVTLDSAVQTECGVIELVPEKRSRSCPSRNSFMSMSSNKTEPREEHNTSSHSSMFSSTSSRWSFRKSTAPAQALDFMVPMNLMPTLPGSPPMLQSMQQPGILTVPSSPEPGLKFPPNMNVLAGRRPTSLSGARGRHTRRPMKSLELPPSPDRQRFLRKVCRGGYGLFTREDELVDQLSIPQTESVVDVHTLPGMSPSEGSEPFSPPMSPTRIRYGRHTALSVTPGSTPAIPLSPVTVKLLKGGNGVSIAVQTEEFCSPEYSQLLPSPRKGFDLLIASRLQRGGSSSAGSSVYSGAQGQADGHVVSGSAGGSGSVHPQDDKADSPTPVTPLPEMELPELILSAAVLSDNTCEEEEACDPDPDLEAARKESEDDLQYSCDDSHDDRENVG